MLDLHDRKWGEFVVTDLFEVTTGTENNMNALKSGETPLISAKKTDNGLKAFVTAGKIKNGDVITWNKDGDGGAGLAYYQPFDFAADSHILVLVPKKELSRYACIFVSRALSQYYGIFGHGRAISLQRAKNIKILLPVTVDNTPDWTFMEQYVCERERALIQGYKEFAEENAHLAEQVVPLGEKEWKTFPFDKIFLKPQRGRRLKTADHHKGNMPYVSSTAVNNGVDNFISNNRGVRRFEDCLTLANSGSVGKTFYHMYEFVASDHVTRLKNPEFNKYIYLFLAPLVSRLEEKYSFNREINDTRITKEVLLLPVTSDGNPDWEYMEQYTKVIMGRQVGAYLDYLRQRS